MEEARQYSIVAGDRDRRLARSLLLLVLFLLISEIALATYEYYFWSYERGEYHWSFSQSLAAGAWRSRLLLHATPFDVGIVLFPLVLAVLTRRVKVRAAIALWLVSLDVMFFTSLVYGPGAWLWNVTVTCELLGFVFCAIASIVVSARRLWQLARR